MSYTTRTTCRVCGATNLVPLFSLGNQWVSNFVDPADVDKGPRIPIDIDQCRQCTLVQARHTPPPELLYQRFYWYKSGATATMRAALKDVAQAAERLVDLKPGDVVLDIGSNDGTLLRSYSMPAHYYSTPGLIKVGVEPAENLAEVGEEGVNVLIQDFWSADAYLDAEYRMPVGCYSVSLGDLTRGGKPQRPKVITALGMFYDLDDPNQFIADVAKVLAPDGVFIAQLMCLKQTLDQCDVGNFAHEHLEFYTLRSLAELMRRHGLQIFDIEENDVNGGSYRLYIRHQGTQVGTPGYASATAQCSGFFHLENDRLHHPDRFAAFRSQIESNRRRIHGFIRDAVANGKRVWVYGASTKGNVILQWLQLDHNTIEAAADVNPDKFGKVTVGTGIPIVPVEEFRRVAPDYALVLPYAFRAEFLEKEAAWRAGGGRFIFPLPQMEVV